MSKSWVVDFERKASHKQEVNLIGTYTSGLSYLCAAAQLEEGLGLYIDIDSVHITELFPFFCGCAVSNRGFGGGAHIE